MGIIKEVEQIIKKYNPNTKIKKAGKFMEWYLKTFNASAICLPGTVYLRHEYYENPPLNTLFHEGCHMRQMKECGKFLYILKYIFFWPVFKTFRWKVEYDANRISFFVNMLNLVKLGCYNENYIDRFIKNKLASVSWCLFPYVYCNIEYKTNYDKWYKKCYDDLKQVEQQALGKKDFENEYFKEVYNFIIKKDQSNQYLSIT